MNKFKYYFILACMASCVLGCKWEKYNYRNIFKLDDKDWNSAKKVKDSNAILLSLSDIEFKIISAKFPRAGFQKWMPLDDIQVGSGKLILSKNKYIIKSQGPIFCKKNEAIEGSIPVIVYYPEQNILYLVIADFIL